jgi:hypothetical protein
MYLYLLLELRGSRTKDLRTSELHVAPHFGLTSPASVLPCRARATQNKCVCRWQTYGWQAGFRHGRDSKRVHAQLVHAGTVRLGDSVHFCTFALLHLCTLRRRHPHPTLNRCLAVGMADSAPT